MTGTLGAAPPLPAALADAIAAIVSLPRATVLGWVLGGTRLLVRSDRAGLPGLWLVDPADGSFEPLVTGEEIVGSARVMGASDEIVLELDHDGDEIHQLHHLRLADRSMAPLVVDPGVIHDLGPAGRGGRSVAYASNTLDRGRFDVHVRSLADGSDRIVWSPGGYAYPAAFSPDDSLLVAGRIGARSLETELVVLDLEDGTEHAVSIPSSESVLWGYADGHPAISWRPDGSAFLFLVNADREFLGLAEWTVADGAWRYVVEADCDLAFALDDSGTLLLVTENREGASRTSLRDARTFGEIRTIDLPGDGTATDWSFSPDGRAIAFQFQSTHQPSDVWIAEVATGAVRPVTEDAVRAALPVPPVTADVSTVTSFDGEPVQVMVYRPSRPLTNPPPVAIVIHGGPEMQAKCDFDAHVQALTAAGFLVLRPNIRGSTGFGRRFASLDDETLRLDALGDVVAIHKWAGATGVGDARKTVLWGVSYGGLLSNLALAHEPDRWAAAVVAVAVSNIASFLETIAPWRRPVREAEYGALDDHRAFFERIAAVNNAGRIIAPLFLAHAVNDIRVPIGESYQLRAALAELGREPPLVVFRDDGHHFDRVANRVRFVTEAIAFLLGVLSRKEDE